MTVCLDEKRSIQTKRRVIIVGMSLAVGVFIAQGPPVPIPNTEVKLCGAEDTCLATSWENRSMPTSEAVTQLTAFKLFKHRAKRMQAKMKKLVLLLHRVHLYPFRTQKLSCAKPKILAWRRAGKIGQCQHFSYSL